MKTKLHWQVTEFHEKFGHSVRKTPCIPPEDEMRFRLRLITEEYLEVLEAVGIDPTFIESVEVTLHNAILRHPLKVDLPKLVDALGDLDFVNEGTRIVCGVDGSMIADEISRANLEKHPTGATKKPTKPADWREPEIGRVLLDQGWDPPR